MSRQRHPPDAPNVIPTFLELVLDGLPIHGFGDRCSHCGVGPAPTSNVKPVDRKALFLKLGLQVLRYLKENDVIFGAGDAKTSIYANPAGPAISGDIVLVTKDPAYHHDARASAPVLRRLLRDAPDKARPRLVSVGGTPRRAGAREGLGRFGLPGSRSGHGLRCP